MTLQEACPLLWSDAEIVKFCSNVRVNTDAAVGVVDIGGGHSCVRVVRLGREVCVKFGLGVSKEEAENQTEAYALLSPHIVRVPRVFRFFSNVAPGDYTRGYLIMEYIEGDTLLLDDLAHIDRVASMLARFSETQSHMPGPLHRGGAQGPVWSDYEKPCFRNTDNLECWLNRRLQASDPRLALKDFPLVLCHLDIAPRNILWQQDGTPCLIDWASAGFYPRFFETCILMISDGMNGDFEPMLLESMESLTSVETSQLRSLMQSYGNGMRFYFVGLGSHSVRPRLMLI